MRKTTNYNLTLISPIEDSQQTSATFINKLCGYGLPSSEESNMEILDRVIKELHDGVVLSNDAHNVARDLSYTVVAAW